MATLRRLTIGDEELARHVARLFKSRQSSIDHMRAMLSDDANYVIVAIEDDAPVGFVLGYALSRMDRDQSMMFLYEIEVLEHHRRHGIGRALVEALDKICRDHHFVKMFVLTDPTNLPAQQLYQSTGGHRGDSDQAMFGYDYDLE